MITIDIYRSESEPERQGIKVSVLGKIDPADPDSPSVDIIGYFEDETEMIVHNSGHTEITLSGRAVQSFLYALANTKDICAHPSNFPEYDD